MPPERPANPGQRRIERDGEPQGEDDGDLGEAPRLGQGVENRIQRIEAQGEEDEKQEKVHLPLAERPHETPSVHGTKDQRQQPRQRKYSDCRQGIFGYFRSPRQNDDKEQIPRHHRKNKDIGFHTID